MFYYEELLKSYKKNRKYSELLQKFNFTTTKNMIKMASISNQNG